MTRVKKGVHALKTRHNVLRQAKGYRFARSKKEGAAYEALVHAGSHAFAHRRDKKGDFRGLWNVVINGAAKKINSSYGKFMHALKQKDVGLNRKMLALIIQNNPETFERIAKKIS